MIEVIYLRKNKIKSFNVENPMFLKNLEKLMLTDNKIESFDFTNFEEC